MVEGGPEAPMSGSVTRLTNFLHKYAETAFIVIVLVILVVVFHWVPGEVKIAFLNFFYLPVLAAGYLMGARRAILSSVLCALVVVIYYAWVWNVEAAASGAVVSQLDLASANQETLLQLAIWAGFLMIVGGAFGRVNEHVMSSYVYVQELNKELQNQAGELRDLNTALQSSSKDLQRKAEELQRVSSTMDAAVARMIIQGRLREEKRNLTVLFCDLKGFTTYSHARSPEVILDDLNTFYGAMEDIVEAYHGHVDKYMGDGIMCEFGAPLDHQQHRLQAIMAAYQMQEKFHAGEFAWKLRIGVASGDAIVGLFGSRRRAYSAIGEVVNLASRLEELAEPGSIYLDENTFEMVQPFVECQQIRNLGGRREEDEIILEQISDKEEQLRKTPKDSGLLFQIGKLHFQRQEASRALDYFRRAMELRPEDNDIKLAFAEASVKQDEFEKISIRGLDQKQAVFTIVGLKDPLQDRNRFPEKFYKQFQNVPSLIEVPDSLVHPVEVIDGTLGHSLSVAVIAYAIADQLELPENEKKDILTAARLQDLGKALVEQHLLNRSGGLSDQERRELAGHVNESVEKARDQGYDKKEVLDIIANHHELMNGAGYPQRARGDEIPLGARITCVADVYCALTAWRPYRDAWDSRVAIRELGKGADSGKYDPKVVETLKSLLS
jgi:putative nucleotidyltransferase with HDIG domain